MQHHACLEVKRFGEDHGAHSAMLWVEIALLQEITRSAKSTNLKNVASGF